SGLAADWTHMAPEWSLDSPTRILVGKNEFLRVRGRIDLILARGTRKESRLPFENLWLIDYKTGRQRGLNLHERRSKEASAEKFMSSLVDSNARERFACELNRNFSVVASAGSGKTRAITNRVVQIARSPLALEWLPQLVVVTYTNRAADEMQQRARQQILEH